MNGSMAEGTADSTEDSAGSSPSDVTSGVTSGITSGITSGMTSGMTSNRIALVELGERDARDGRDGRDVRFTRAIDVQRWPLSIGRALDNDIVLDDPWIAPHHAVIDADGQGRLALRVLQTINGVDHAGKRIAGGGTLLLPAEGGTLGIGGTRLRVRLPGETLAAEKPLPTLVPGKRWQPLVMLLALMALMLAGQWVTLDPGTDYSAWLPLAIGVPVALGAWCGAWALMSKLFQHRFDFSGHLRIALPWMLAISIVDVVLPQLAASLAAPWLWHLSSPVQALLTALLLRAHLVHVLPLHQRMVSATVAVCVLVAGGLSVALTQRSTDRLVAAPYMSTLPLPGLRLGGTVPMDTLVQDMAPLAGKLATRVRKAKKDEAEAGGEAADGDSDD